MILIKLDYRIKLNVLDGVSAMSSAQMGSCGFVESTGVGPGAALVTLRPYFLRM